MKTVTIDVAPDGEIKVEAHGFKGRGCEAITEPFEKALGAPGKRTKKAEWYQHAGVNAQQKVGA